MTLSLFNSLSSLVFITSLYSLSVPSFYVGVSILVCLYSQVLDPLGDIIQSNQFKYHFLRTSLAVQWLRLCES